MLFPAATSAQGYRQHAEYEPTEAIWMLWPQVMYKQGFPNELVIIQMIQALAPATKVKLVVPSEKKAETVRKLIPSALLKNESVSIIILPYLEFWARDTGPVFVSNNTGEKAIADFNFNTWGYTDTSDAAAQVDEQLDEQIAAMYKLPVLNTWMASEGGNREVNGKGTLLLTETVELHRNPGKTKAELEPEYKRLLGVSNIIWLPQGLRDDDLSHLPPITGPGGKTYYTMLTTGGHVDEFARFVNDSTILLAWIGPNDRSSDLEQQTGQRMEANYRILQQARDQDGRPFNIIKMPMPYLMTTTLSPGDSAYSILRSLQLQAGQPFPDGKPVDCVAAASYLNFVVANDVVLVPTYWKEGMPRKIRKRDAEAQAILQQVFPGKAIIPIDALAINYGGGGMHCITINEPKIQ